MKLSLVILRNENDKSDNVSRLRDSIFLSLRNAKNKEGNEILEWAEVYYGENKSKSSAIKEVVYHLRGEYIIFIDEHYDVMPYFFEKIYDGLKENPDCISCGIKDTYSIKMYSINKENKHFDLRFPSYFNIIKREHYLKLNIPDIKELVTECFSYLFEEKDILKKEYFIFDTLLISN
jgi:hypothetical protein